MRAIKKNMQDQILTNDNKILHCTICGSECSGNAGDYWDLHVNHVFTCCGYEMELVTKIVSVNYY
jgi:hydroxymethylpyrimidine/phosphomethylpyrimidine kinase